MKASLIWRRLLGLVLAVAVVWAQTGAVVAVSLEDYPQQSGESVELEIQETETPVISEEPESTPGEETEEPALPSETEAPEEDMPEVVERPVPPAEETIPPKESREPEETEPSGPPEEILPPGEEPTPEPGNDMPPAEDTLPEFVMRPLGAAGAPEEAALFGERTASQLRYQLGYGVGYEFLTEYETYNDVIALTDFENQFTIETRESTSDWDSETDTMTNIVSGYRYYYNPIEGNDYKIPYEGDIYNEWSSFCVFPSEEMMGRVPDREFEGWYLYPENRVKEFGDLGSSLRNVLSAWKYEENIGMIPLDEILRPYGPDAPRYSDLYEEGDGTYIDRPYSDLGGYWDGGEYDFYAQYGYGTETGKFEDSKTPVSIVGRWVPSSQAKAAEKDGAAFTVSGSDTPLALYGADITGKTAPEEIDFSPEKTEYWLRVDADVTALDLVFNTYELYYDYNKNPEGKSSPVAVTNTFGERVDTYTEGLSQKLLPEQKDNTSPAGASIPLPGNSIDDPAHSEWAVKGISLIQSAGKGQLYNDIQVTVTAPNGEATTTYTFHVQRLTEPTLTRAPGNTPAGMIQRDTSAYWGTTPEDIQTNKATAREYFKANRSFDFTSQQYPRDAEHNQGGSIFRGKYTANAWVKSGIGTEEQDIDLDPTAIVVYQDAVFLDPGVTVTDSEGNQVTLSGGNVKRTLTLRQQGSLSISGVGDKQGTQIELPSTVSAAGGCDQVDLRGKNILPGIYTMEYSFTDPISGKTYDSSGAGFVTTAGAVGKNAFARTVVVLPVPGDVDMDGAVTSADGVILERNMGTNLAGHETLNGLDVTVDKTAALFAFRVCDPDQNGSLNQSDVDLLEKLPSPQRINSGNVSESDYYYIPLPTGEKEDHYTRRTLEEKGAGSGAVVSMEYLGKEGGTRSSSGYYTNPTGPWSGNSQDGIVLNDTFWLGIKLTDGVKSTLLNKSVQTFTFSLTYDAQYVEPAIVLNQQSWQAQDNDLSRWRDTLTYYNLGGGSSGRTVWGAGNAYRLTQATNQARSFTTHYSKAITPLEANAGVGTKLRELVFSVEISSASVTAATLNQSGSIWLFAVPFTLVQHPYGQTTARLVEMGAGMDGFTVVGTETTATSSLSLGRMVSPMEVLGRSMITPAAAYSSQDAIFGGTTGNLRDEVSYAASGADVPLGEDKTEVNIIYNQQTLGASSRTNGVYSTNFAAFGGVASQSGDWVPFPLHGEVSGELPKGLESDGYNKISGIPEETGTFKFYIGSTPYLLVIDKAPLRFWADNQTSYYGQPEFRGSHRTDFTFRYNVEDIKSIDRARADGVNIFLDGDGAHLKDLLDDKKYTAPTFTAVVGGATPVAAGTNVGTYSITCPLLPESANYKFEYAPTTTNSRLTIISRPYLVDRIAPTNVGLIYTDESGVISNKEAQLTAPKAGVEAVTGFYVKLPHNSDEQEGYYEKLPLTPMEGYIDGVLMQGDSLKITYDAEYIRTVEDNNSTGGHFFTLEEGNSKEERSIRTGNIRMENAGSSNYRLVSRIPVEPEAEGVLGTVTRRNVRELNIVQVPPLKYQYGSPLTNTNELHFYLAMEGGGQAGIYAYTEKTETELGVKVTWALPEEREAYQHPENYPQYTVDGKGERWTPAGWETLVTEKGWDSIPFQGKQIFDMTFDGRYLCMSVQTADVDGKSITVRQYWDKPLSVSPLTLTLTATPAQRFYGEENGELTFTYRPQQLASCDRKTQTLTGKGEELLEILKDQNYTPPTLKAVDSVTAQNELEPKSAYGASYAVMISGAKCDNYVFEYVFNQAGSSEIRTDMGASSFEIMRRPIVVDGVARTEPLVTIYADTHKIALEDQALALNEVQVGLPEHTETTTEYYPRGGIASTQPVRVQVGYAPDAPVILEGDELSFTYTATVVSTDGADYVKYRSFAHGYFNMDKGVGESYDEKEYPVQVSNLRLVGKSAENYTLVFRDNNAAILSLPTSKNTTTVSGIEPEQRADRAYYVPKTTADGGLCKAKVVLRPIESIEIVTPGKLAYTYGELYRPDSQQGLAMQIKISYTRQEPEDTAAGNPTTGYVTMAVSRYEGAEAFTTFDDRSLVIYWMHGEDTEENRNQAIQNQQELKYQEDLQVETHNGAKLFITGKRGAQTNLVVSKATGDTLKVSPKTLTLTAGDASRCYGEPNPEVSFTFNREQLARGDQEQLAGYSGAMDGNALSNLARMTGKTYVPPTISAVAKQDSPVLNDGKGYYDITISGGELSNYTFEYRPGKLYVHPRMIKIGNFISDKDRPIYTIFASMTAHVFTTSLTTTESADQPSVQMTLPTGGAYTLPGTDTRLPVTGSAIYGDDELTLTIQVQFEDMSEDELKGNNGLPVEATVISAKLEPGRGSENYVLEKQGTGAANLPQTTTGKVELRSIQRIAMTGPSKLEYTYGEELDLSDLVVTLYYNLIGGEAGDPLPVRFLSTEQFASYGLYVNYYPYNELPKDESAWANIASTYPKASTGDHLTIAPVHDVTIPGLPANQAFSANGKYLVVTAQRHEAQNTSALLVGTPITVKPLALEFELEAEDKTYDDTREGAGTLTLNNVYRRGGVVDMVYPVTGAGYEKGWNSLASGAASFKEYVNRNNYSFSTGSYHPAGPAPLGENYSLDRPEGYDYGRSDVLKFTFVDSNVRYQDPAAASKGVYGDLDKVDMEVTGILLAGPDAANYTIAGAPFGTTTSVTKANVAYAEGYKGTTVPSAVIHKRNRDKLNVEFSGMPKVILPLVELDVHTNVVRIDFERALSSIPGAGADTQTKPEGLHYEYALQYNASTEDYAAVGQWAGMDGGAMWGDAAYFGGEAVQLDMRDLVLGGYVPKEEDIPEAGEDMDLKGQLYRWDEEDDGFRLDPSAYPGTSEEPWPGYSLYTTDRTKLERGVVYLPLVRVAESHNYNASPAISSVAGYTPERIQETQEALEMLENAAGNPANYEKAREKMDEVAKEVLTEWEETVTEAERVADEEAAQLAEIGESGKWPEEWTERPPAPAVRTYRQRLDAISVKELQSDGAAAASESFQVPTLEAVWFTDIWDYPKKEVLDAVLHNNDPVRYRAYFWDKWHSAELDFEGTELPVNLETTDFLVPVKRKENGQEIEDVISVNTAHNAQIYVDISKSSGGSYLIQVESITIDSGDITAALGEEPQKLTVTIYPENSSNRAIRWSSSDPSVVTVSRDGTITFVGVGTAVITATSVDGPSDSITVTVVEELQDTLYPNSIFDFQKVESFFDLDEDMLFGPEVEMTRGEVAQILARFYVENPNWTKTGPEDFPDLTGKEEYAEAARLLGSVGVMTGLPGGEFGGERFMTRAEFVAMLVRMMGIDVPDTRGQKHAFLDTFEDTTGVEGTWAYAEIDALSKVEGVLQGVGDGYFAPRRNITRAEAASFLSRLLQFPIATGKGELRIPTDVGEDHWARGAILRAVNQGTVPPQQSET